MFGIFKILVIFQRDYFQDYKLQTNVTVLLLKRHSHSQVRSLAFQSFSKITDYWFEVEGKLTFRIDFKSQSYRNNRPSSRVAWTFKSDIYFGYSYNLTYHEFLCVNLPKLCWKMTKYHNSFYWLVLVALLSRCRTLSKYQRKPPKYLKPRVNSQCYCAINPWRKCCPIRIEQGNNNITTKHINGWFIIQTLFSCFFV